MVYLKFDNKILIQNFIANYYILMIKLGLILFSLGLYCVIQ